MNPLCERCGGSGTVSAPSDKVHMFPLDRWEDMMRYIEEHRKGHVDFAQTTEVGYLLVEQTMRPCALCAGTGQQGLSVYELLAAL